MAACTALWKAVERAPTQHHCVPNPYAGKKTAPSHPPYDLALGCDPLPLDGFLSLLERLPKRPPTVWMTADPQRAIQAYRAGIDCCLPLPLSRHHLGALRQRGLHPEAAKHPSAAQQLTLQSPTGYRQLSLAALAHLHCDPRQVHLYFRNGSQQSCPVDRRPANDSWRHNPHLFARTPQHFIVLNAIRSVDKIPYKNYRIHLAGPYQLELTPAEYRRLWKQMNEG